MPTESGKLGVALIGCGEISDQYMTALREQEDGEAVWCMDVVESQAKRVSEHYEVPWTTDLDKVLADERVDVVIVAVPHGLHAEVTLKCAAAGKHVMCDKPMETNREAALRMIEGCKAAGVKLGINLASRFQPFAGIAKDLLDRKVIGDIILVKISAYARKADDYWTTGRFDGGNTSWRGTKKLGGGGIGIMNMTHEIDRVRYCSGLEIVQMKGESDTFMTNVEVEDTLAAVWRYSNGAIGLVVAGSHLYGNSQEPTRIFGTQGQLELWDPVRVFTTREDTEFPANEWHTIEVEWNNNYVPYIREFLKAVREDTDPPITGEDGFRVLDAVLGIYDSSETKQTVFMSSAPEAEN